ncbi:MAG: hypothetical protein FP812_09115 [Desulfobacula sp.]|nr:hypothetical protein [Desulfobacula sp.]
MKVGKQIFTLVDSLDPQNKERLWELVADNDLEKVIELLSGEGICDTDLGEVLSVFAQQALKERRFGNARKILRFLIGVLEDKNEAPLLLSFIGDSYVQEGNPVKAREYYGQLPLTFENIQKVFSTFIPSKDLAGLLNVRDNILSKVPDPAHVSTVHHMVNSIFIELAENPTIKNKTDTLYAANLLNLKKIDPSIVKNFFTPTTDKRAFAPDPRPVKCLKISDNIYVLEEKIWRKIQPRDPSEKLQRKNFPPGTYVAIRCASFEQLSEFRDALKTDHPEFFKFQCYLITDLKTLERFMGVEDLLPLTDCDYVIKIFTENDLETQLYEALINDGCNIPTHFVKFTEQDAIFSSKKLIPALEKTKRIIAADVQNQERKLAAIFPEGYRNNVLQKIHEMKKLKILFQTSRFTSYLQHSIRDMAEGFENLGCRVFIETEKKGAALGIRGDICRKNLIEFQPDLIFSINHLRHEYRWIPKSIPYVTWIQDPMPNIFELSDPTLLGKNDYIYTVTKVGPNGTDRLTEHPVFRNFKIGFLPIMFNQKIYNPLDIKPKYDVSYVSHFNMPKEYYAVYSDLPDSKLSCNQLIFRHFIHYTSFFSIYELSRVLNNFYKDKTFWEGFIKDLFIVYPTAKLKITSETPVFFIQNLLHKIIKSRVLKKVIDMGFDLHLFGNGWELHPWFKHHTKGPIKNGEALNRLYNETKINLNLNPGMLLHPKFSEVIGGGNFCLTLDLGQDICLPVENYFHNYASIALFNEEDLGDKLSYFLNNPEERRKNVHLFFTDVLEKFSSRSGAKGILLEIAGKTKL